MSTLFSFQNVDEVADVNRTRSVTIQITTEARRIAVWPNHPKTEHRQP